MMTDGLPPTVYSVVQAERDAGQDTGKPTSPGPQLNSAVPENATAKDAAARQRSLPRQLRHDLRSYLNQVLGYSDLLRDEAREQKLISFADDLDKIYSAGRELLVLINEHIDPITPHADNTPEVVMSRSQPTMPVSTVLEMLRRANTVGNAGHRGHLLILENSPESGESLAYHLERQGHSVTVVRSGREVLERATSQSYDLVLLDILLPEMNGFEVLKALKSDANLRHLPVMMISAFDDMQSIVHSIESGAEDYIFKPYNPVLLRARIEACLEKKWLRDAEQRLVAQLRKDRERLERGSAEVF